MKYLPKILILDDESDFLSRSSALLRKSGFDVYSLLDAEEVFGIVERYRPDIVFLDIRLGSHDGRSICREIRDRYDIKFPKIILQSVLPEFGMEYREHGADDFLLKPFTMDQLIAMIKHHLRWT